MKSLNNFWGAFADGAVLFPLMMTLSLQNGMDLSILLLSSGLAYLAAGYVFRIPMSVQPLKSVAMAGIAAGATAVEIRTAAFFLGLIFVLFLFLNVERYANMVPERLIHGVQVGLGIVLIQQGLRYALPGGIGLVVFTIVCALVMLFVSYRYQYPILGAVASLGFFVSLFWLKGKMLLPTEPRAMAAEQFHPFLVLSLVLPQIVLTSANSVLATVNVSRRFFSERAGKVTVRRLICMIGFGNILSALIGGLPFCHGSGGVTAHYNGGATTNMSNYIIGSSLVVAAIAVAVFGGAQLEFKPILLSILLMTVGCMHVGLAKSSWAKGIATQAQLALMAFAAVAFGNMLWVLGVGLLFEILKKAYGFALGISQYDKI